MDPAVKARLMDDYTTCHGYISAILSGQSPNHLNIDGDYLTPRLKFNSNLPLTDPNGSLQHYLSVRQALETALIHGTLTEEQARTQPRVAAILERRVS